MQELIRRSEGIERDAWRDLYRGAPHSLRRELGLAVVELGGATVLSATGADHLLLNRAVGLGTAPGAVNQVLEHFERRSIPRFWVHMGSDLRYSPLPALLKERGIAPYPRSWMKFVRRADPVDEVPCTLEIRPAAREDRSRVGQVLASGFDLPEHAAPLLAVGLGRAGWDYFVATDGANVVAAAATYRRGEDGYLAFASTLPAARRRGGQRALMAARLELSRRLGCRQVFTETGMPVEGEPNSSYRNILRVGFDELHVRDSFAPEGTRWHKLPSSDAIARSAVSPEPSKKRPVGTVPPGF
jgi:GNAT superfamily N-acetyltransferase